MELSLSEIELLCFYVSSIRTFDVGKPLHKWSKIQHLVKYRELKKVSALLTGHLKKYIVQIQMWFLQVVICCSPSTSENIAVSMCGRHK